jgi:hypothetical protein
MTLLKVYSFKHVVHELSRLADAFERIADATEFDASERVGYVRPAKHLSRAEREIDVSYTDEAEDAARELRDKLKGSAADLLGEEEETKP